MRLDPAAIAAGVGIVTHEEIDSTSSAALRLARAGERGPLWVVAQTQSQGRGRRGRTWVSAPGNLYASLLLTDAGPTERMAEICFVAALAVYDAICEVAPAVTGRLSLKWPNDILLDGCKVSGILIEGEHRATVIGIGVNCLNHPAQVAYPVTDLGAAGLSAQREDVLAALSASILRRFQQWVRGEGFAAIREDWLTRAAGLGGRIVMALPQGERAGCFESIDARGCLVLRLDDGTRETVTAGDILSPAAV